MAARGGPQALQAWSQAWTSGVVSPHLARFWSGALVRPFFKANGIDVRPVLCSEALVKLALGSAVDTVHDEVQEAMGPQQSGAATREVLNAGTWTLHLAHVGRVPLPLRTSSHAAVRAKMCARGSWAKINVKTEKDLRNNTCNSSICHIRTPYCCKSEADTWAAVTTTLK